MSYHKGYIIKGHLDVYLCQGVIPNLVPTQKPEHYYRAMGGGLEAQPCSSYPFYPSYNGC